ncbi:hypothetical protein V8C40DRAFT_277294 [Trichoderma camerunense]
MSSTSLSNRQWDPTWNGLPTEIRLLIFKALAQDGCRLSPLATVSREWQIELMPHNFARIKLTPSCLADFNSMIRRNRASVAYIYAGAEFEEALAIGDTDHCPITTIYSPSDSKHWFKYLTFMPDTALDTLDGRLHHDPGHGWGFGGSYHSPPRRVLLKSFHPMMEEGPFDSDQSELQWWDRLPSNRRKWKPKSLAHMEWNFKQGLTYRQYPYLSKSIQRFNGNLKRIVVFENFNQQYPMTMQRFPFGVEVSGHFFNIEPSWEWPNLTSLVLTSKLLAPDKSPIEIGAMLQAAAAVATKMPQLKTMEIWNGRKGVAALFKYQVFHDVQQARIIWRGTWEFIMEPSVIRAWEAFELLDEATIKSHGGAIGYLMLSGQVIRPISLQQIRIEQRALKGVMTMSE